MAKPPLFARQGKLRSLYQELVAPSVGRMGSGIALARVGQDEINAAKGR